MALYDNETVDLNNKQALSDAAMARLKHGQYFKNCRGFILPNGVVVYTEAEHNMCTKIPGVKNTFHFIELGCIRLLDASVDLACPPTNKQWEVLSQVFDSYYGQRLDLDLMNKQIGAASKTYRELNPEEVTRDIQSYFTNGRIRNEYSLYEMAYPVTFSMEQMLALNSYSARLKYCESHLQKIGQGSSRMVFAVDNEKVLKVAKNKKGIAQNQEESQEWLQNYYDCFAKVYDYSDDGIFLEMQAARKAKKSDFKRLTGYDFNVFCAYIDYVHSWYSTSRYRGYRDTEYDELFKSEQFQEGLENYNLFYNIQSYISDTQLESVGDLKRLSSWGVVSENGQESLVLIDFGLSDDVYDDYYAKR